MSRARLRRRTFLATLLLPLTQLRDGRASAVPFAGALGAGERAIRASDFIDGLGVNGHVSWPGHYPYSETSRVAEAMAYLGVRTLRDHINASTQPVFERLADRGVRFDLLLNPKVGIDNYVAWARALAKAYPGVVAALEGPNEVDKWPVQFEGRGGLQAAAEVQRVLYAMAKREPLLARVPVYNLTLSGISRSKAAELGDLSAHADYANVHPYYRAGQQSWGHSLIDARYTLKAYMAAARWTAPGRPVVLTESGSTTAVGSDIGVTEAVQARQILNSLFAAAAHGASAISIYELVESHANGAQDPESHYGLYRYDWTPKPAAHALHNLTSILQPRGGTDEGRPPTRLTRHAVRGLPANGASLVLLQDDGSYDLAIWAEPDLWDEVRHRPLATTRSVVQVDFEAVSPFVELYDPLLGAKPLETFRRIRRVEVPLADHPVILKVT